jgi:hypothetical protein
MGNVSVKFQNETFHFKFRFRDPWEWVRSLVTDKALCDSITWYPVQKYLHDDGHTTRLIDEPHTAKMWWQIQVGTATGLVHREADWDEEYSSSSDWTTALLSSATALVR